MEYEKYQTNQSVLTFILNFWRSEWLLFFSVLAVLLPCLQLILYPHRLNLTLCFTVIHVRLKLEKRLSVNGQAHTVFYHYTLTSPQAVATHVCAQCPQARASWVHLYGNAAEACRPASFPSQHGSSHAMLSPGLTASQTAGTSVRLLSWLCNIPNTMITVIGLQQSNL